MKIEFKPICKKINMSEYAAEFGDASIDVQVNVTRDLLKRMRSVTKDTSDSEFMGILQELWGADAWPMEDIQALASHCRENDPVLWTWLTNKTWWLVLEYQGFVKKKLAEQILSAARTKKVSGMGAQIIRTKQINQALGTNLAPWDLDQVPDDWLSAVEMWSEDYPKAVDWQRQIDASLARVRGQ